MLRIRLLKAIRNQPNFLNMKYSEDGQYDLYPWYVQIQINYMLCDYVITAFEITCCKYVFIHHCVTALHKLYGVKICTSEGKCAYGVVKRALKTQNIDNG